MGTIEHFDETEHAVGEIARVLKQGGHAIVGVPNRHDPFLRLLEGAGREVVAETAILFMPGWLRILDLACHAWCRPLTPITSALVRPFVFLDRHLPATRRHGYLLATIVGKPDTGPQAAGR